MSIREYIQNEVPEIEIELAESLPVCNRGKEYIFYYSTSSVDEDSFKIDKIFYIFVWDRKTCELTKMLPEEVLPEQMLLEVVNCIISPSVFDEEAMDMEDKYYNCYEKVLDIIAQKEITEDNQRVIAELRNLFNKLVPDSTLKDIYSYLRKSI